MRTRPLFLALGLLLSTQLPACRHTNSGSDTKYYGTDSQTALLTFDASVEFHSQILLKDDAKEKAARSAIDLQAEFLFGTLKEHSGSNADGSIDFRKSPGVPSTDHKIVIKSIQATPGTGQGYVYKVEYSYEDTVAFSKNFLRNGKQQLKLRLPKNPKAIYALGNVGDKNKCTDDHYNSEGDFWYFWNPYKSGCPDSLKNETLLIQATMNPIPNTERTYPEYARMEDDKVVEIAYLVGPDHDKTDEADAGRSAFEKTFEILQAGKGLLKAENPWTLAGTEKYFSSIDDAADVRFKVEKNETFEKVLTAENKGIKYRVVMKIMDPNDEAESFKVAYKEALKTADVVIYDGHSGLGWNLDLTRYFAKDEPSLPQDKYQIYFFNACSTFAYFNQKYFQRKVTANDPKGTKNLDIVTTSIGALFSVAAATDAVFILSLANGTHPSWQKIMDAVYDVDPKSSALTQINGDEDNPTSLDK